MNKNELSATKSGDNSLTRSNFSIKHVKKRFVNTTNYVFRLFLCFTCFVSSISFLIRWELKVQLNLFNSAVLRLTTVWILALKVASARIHVRKSENLLILIASQIISENFNLISLCTRGGWGLFVDDVVENVGNLVETWVMWLKLG